MQLLPELANKIIGEVRLVIKEDLIVVDENGIIIASTQDERVGDFHEIAKLVVRTREKYYIKVERARKIEGVKAGINLPIFFEKKVVGVIGITGSPESVEGYADLIRKMTELMVRETYYAEQREWEMRGLEAYLYEWVFSKEVDVAFIHRGQLLGVSIGKPYLCVLLQVESIQDIQIVHSYVMRWFRGLFPGEGDDVFIRWGEGRFLLLKSYKNEQTKHFVKNELCKWQRYFQTNYSAKVSFGISKSVAKSNLNQAYHEAKKALNVAQNQDGVVAYDDLVLDIILEEVNIETREEFIDRVLAEIYNKQELVDTLKVYLSYNQSIKDAAIHMNIHINTLHYRLKQIKEITGIDPKNAEGITLFYVALCFLGIDEHRSDFIESNHYS
ncbi:CdaR family transcriptional regulator [Halobacillus ihumii]|uniref:CdaR family transcriptional regulator n=1 Tax=Halobacillus ihumii TaxID=2686092 RepID=UPI0013D51976|nr:sugar diacid recognition domain-containing protein [Halobacillus ihumii]